MPARLPYLKTRTFLLGVGAQKAGTTWLYYYLDKHPDVYMSPIKEMHFFGNRSGAEAWPLNSFRKKLRERKKRQQESNPQSEKPFIALRERIRMQGNMAAYKRFFRKRVGKRPVFGEITPAYSKLPLDELRFVQGHFPKTKVIFLMRNPVDRLWSQMRFSEQFNNIEELENRLDSVLDQSVYAERVDYIKTIHNLRNVFAPEQVHYEFYEHLFTDDAVVRLCNFLEIPYKPANFSKKRNVSTKVPLSPLLRPKVVTALRGQYDFMCQEFGDQVPKNWIEDMQNSPQL